MASTNGNEELQKKVSEFIVDSLQKLEDLNIDFSYSAQLLSVLASGYPVVVLTEDNAKWEMGKKGDLVHWLCDFVIKQNDKIYYLISLKKQT